MNYLNLQKILSETDRFKITFWDVILCSLVDKLQCFKGLCYLCLQDGRLFYYSEDEGIRFPENVHTKILVFARVGTTDVT
jgi:hypothetical protein